MRLNILLLLILSNARIILASDVVVLDSITREPIPFAHLLIKENGRSQSYLANLDGLIEYPTPKIEFKPEFTFKASFYTEKKYIESVPDTVMLIPSQNLLNEVVVSGQREFTKLSERGFYITISNNPVSNLASVVKMIQQLPLVDAVNEKLTIIGKRKTALYVGNRKVNEQSEILSYSPADIEAVEIITEPGLKYGRDVDAVIIIHPKKKDLGLNLSVNGDYINQRGLNSALGNSKIGYSFSNNWVVETFLSTSKYANKGTRDDSDFVRTNYSTNTHAVNKFDSENYSAQLSLFKESKSSSYGVKYLYKREPSSTSTTSGEYLTSFSDNENINGIFNSETQTSSYRHLINAYYNNSFSFKLSFNIDFNAYIGKKSDIDCSDFNAEKESSISRSNHEMKYSLVEAKAVLGYSFKKYSIEGGVEYSYTSTKQDLYGVSGFTESSSFNNQYQNLCAVFVSAGYRATKELRLNAGMRGEFTSNKYTSSDISSDYTESEIYWTPKLWTTYSSGNIKFNFAYSFNIYRPFYFFLTSGYTFLSPTLWQTGNPTLKIDKEHNFDLSINWKKTYAYISYGHGRDRCDYGLSYNSDKKYSIMYPVSVPKMISWAIMLQQRADIRNWHPSLVGILLLQNLRFGADNETFNKPYLRLQWKNMLKLPLDIYAYVNLMWESSGHTNLYYVYNRFRIDLSLSKNVGLFNFNLSLDNLLNTWRLKYTLYSNQVCYIQNNKPYGPIVTLSCSYN